VGGGGIADDRSSCLGEGLFCCTIDEVSFSDRREPEVNGVVTSTSTVLAAVPFTAEVLSSGSLDAGSDGVSVFFRSLKRGGFGAGVVMSVVEVADAVFVVLVLDCPLADDKTNEGIDGEVPTAFQPSGDSTASFFAGGRKGCQRTTTGTPIEEAVVAGS
jgi:hypothetical protein